MRKTLIQLSEQIYGFLLQFYPKKYREQFGDEMKYVFSESLEDAYEEKKEKGLIYMWSRTFFDAGKSLVDQHVDNLKGGDFMNKSDIIMDNKVFILLALATGLILTLSAIAMQFTNEVDWSLFDFVIMGILLFGMGSIFVFAARKFTKNRLLVGLIVLGTLLLTWVHLAVGIVDTWPLAGS